MQPLNLQPVPEDDDLIMVSWDERERRYYTESDGVRYYGYQINIDTISEPKHREVLTALGETHPLYNTDPRHDESVNHLRDVYGEINIFLDDNEVMKIRLKFGDAFWTEPFSLKHAYDMGFRDAHFGDVRLREIKSILEEREAQ